MKSFLFSLVVLFLVVSAFAVPAREGHSRMVRAAKASVGDDPTDECGTLISTLDGAAYQKCDDIGFKLVDDTFSYTDADASSFCTGNCADLMVNTVTQLISKCGMPADDGTIVSSLSPLWHAACATNNGVHCDSLWLQMMSSDYMSCVGQHSDQWPCPDSCKTTLKSLETSLGCCYKSIADVMIKNDPPFYFAEDLWNACGMKEPATCTV